MVTHANLHHALITGIIHKGYAPSIDALATTLSATKAQIIEGLYALQEYHGVVLHPNTPKIWVVHPFSLAPTNFYVESNSGEWWGNCAWCSLGIAAILKEDVTITSTIGAEREHVILRIKNGRLECTDFVIHFPVSMKKAWDNVIYTCSNMLLFKNHQQVDDWCRRHNMPVGDIQPVENIWQFAQKWYGSHASKDWKKWTIGEAKQMFSDFGLNHAIWDLEDTSDRF